jgi:hypothetical protein
LLSPRISLLRNPVKAVPDPNAHLNMSCLDVHTSIVMYRRKFSRFQRRHESFSELKMILCCGLL